MTAPPSPPSRLTADARRSLALLAGDDLDPAAAAEARSLTDDCPHCRGHFESVREGLDVLRRCEPVEQEGGLWTTMRDRLTIAEPATPPMPSRPWIPAFAVTAAALLIGVFAFGPTAGQVLPGWFEPPGVVQPVGEGLERPPAERPRLDRYQSAPFREGGVRGTLDGPRIDYPR